MRTLYERAKQTSKNASFFFTALDRTLGQLADTCVSANTESHRGAFHQGHIWNLGFIEQTRKYQKLQVQLTERLSSHKDDLCSDGFDREASPLIAV